MQPFIRAGKVKIAGRRLAGLLDKSVQNNQPLTSIDIEQESSDAIVVKLRAELVQPTTH